MKRGSTTPAVRKAVAETYGVNVELLRAIEQCKHPSGFNDYLPEWKPDQIHRLKSEGFIKVKRTPAAGMGDVALRVATLTPAGRQALARGGAA